MGTCYSRIWSIQLQLFVWKGNGLVSCRFLAEKGILVNLHHTFKGRN